MPEPEHLKMIQGVIDRMSRCSFALKGWSVTVAAALIGLSKADANPSLAWVAAGAAVTFGLLDAYYLALERAYRSLYNGAVVGTVAPWTMQAARVGSLDVVRTAGRPVVYLLHGVTLVAAVAVALTG